MLKGLVLCTGEAQVQSQQHMPSTTPQHKWKQPPSTTSCGVGTQKHTEKKNYFRGAMCKKNQEYLLRKIRSTHGMAGLVPLQLYFEDFVIG